MQKVAEFLNIEKDELDIHIRHIFEPAIKVIQNATLRINGFHHDYNNLLEKSGMFKFVNKEMFAQGYYKATVEIASKCSTQPVLKSFFPAHWSQEQVMQEIHYAMQNMQIIDKEFSGALAIAQNISKYLANLPQSESIIQCLGSTTDKIDIILIFDINKFAFVSAFPFLR